VPPEVLRALGGGARLDVSGSVAGTAFRGTLSKGEGVHRIPIARALQDEAGVSRGDEVEVTLELDPHPRTVDIPSELRSVLNEDPSLAQLFERLPPAHRRAWSQYVAEAKRPDTRVRRSGKARAGIRARAFPS
jgi:Bacteriocin-protection, YdeI or OmpD-Associated/Domain of unknown function (DUF1905)